MVNSLRSTDAREPNISKFIYMINEPNNLFTNEEINVVQYKVYIICYIIFIKKMTIKFTLSRGKISLSTPFECVLSFHGNNTNFHK